MAYAGLCLDPDRPRMVRVVRRFGCPGGEGAEVVVEARRRVVAGGGLGGAGVEVVAFVSVPSAAALPMAAVAMTMPSAS